MIIGLILHYSSLNKAGIVIDENSVRYQFSSEEWKGESELRCGMRVYFDLNSANRIIKIYKPKVIT
ncbi:hypothetical protein KTJ32_09775 [Acinetobacter gyllenbergii]|jgi:hypothetical protein|uniref:Uncharacterized protein n=1 Tax=Acinetobacter proteolyticus TaxID=1776741 RepID=A0A653K582_9GAMM|nr:MULTISPECIES: hypothetical protein [Acinetobacter]MCU4581273.1 hypothetical protein [Acinetobacter gyllenbergii]VXA55495.1 conserved hypothetical protein [Acinetobacter proteolyticus]